MCDHDWESLGWKSTTAVGNNYDIESKWLTRRCKTCHLEDKLLMDTQITNIKQKVSRADPT